LLSFDFIRDRLSPEQLEEFAVSLGLCLECGGSLKASRVADKLLAEIKGEVSKSVFMMPWADCLEFVEIKE
jgi:hypothetical protein